MEVHFTPEQQEQLAEIATKEGTGPEQLAKDAAMRLLNEEARFRAGVREGIAQADRGEFIDEEEMDAASSRCCDRKSCASGGRPARHVTCGDSGCADRSLCVGAGP